jgi:hypothetical protein
MLITWQCPLCYSAQRITLKNGENPIKCQYPECQYVWYVKVTMYEKEKFEYPSAT